MNDYKQGAIDAFLVMGLMGIIYYIGFSIGEHYGKEIRYYAESETQRAIARFARDSEEKEDSGFNVEESKGE